MQICNAPHAEKRHPLSESAVFKSEAQWSMDDNVIERSV